MNVHPSPFSGTWYPANSADLEHLLEARFEESRQRIGSYFFPGALGYVVPHAGPEWSGTVAAAVYRAIREQQPEHIVVLAFPHHGGLWNLAVPDVDAISTPFGAVSLYGGWRPEFPRLEEDRLCDHSLEIQLPFLQKAAPHSRITALYVGRMDASTRARAADSMAAAWSPGTVFVASSDFTHYGREFGHVPFPADGAVAGRLEELDREYIDAASSLDSSLFLDTLAEHDATVCGSAPIALLLDVLRRLPGDSIYQYTLDYQTSGERTGDFRHSVSYAALGYYPRPAFDLGGSDREALLDIAHHALAHLRRTGERQRNGAHTDSPPLSTPRGAFVSLHQGTELLGCVGNCFGRLPIAEDIAELTTAAASEDPRFRPAASATGAIDVEISILTPFRRIRGIEEFCVNRHGAVMRLGGRTGLLLPQVAQAHHWTADEFWRGLARKSLLGPNAWRDPKVRLEIFEAQVFARPG